MSGLLADLRLACRAFLQQRGFTAVVVATLATGIAACTVVFSLANAVLFKPFDSYREPERLVVLFEQNALAGMTGPTSPRTFGDWKARAGVFERLGGVRPITVPLVGGNEAETVFAAAITADVLPMLDARSAAGRLFTGADFASGAPPVLLLSHAEWQRAFGGAPDIVGRTVKVDGRPATIAGVLDAKFTLRSLFGLDPVAFVPLAAEPSGDRAARSLYGIGRLRPGATTRQARAEMDLISAAIASDPACRGWSAFVHNPREIGEGDSAALLALAAGVGFVLLIVCANVGNMLLARATGKRREMATRCALGASRLRLARQSLVDAMVFGLAGSLAGLGLAWAACRALTWLVAGTNIGQFDLMPDARVAAFAAGVSLLSALIVGAMPAWDLRRVSIVEGIRDGRRSSLGLSSGRLRSVLVAGEIALAIVLVAGGGLILDFTTHLRGVDPGFRADSVMPLFVSLPDGRYRHPADRAGFVREILTRLERRGELVSSAVTTVVPAAGGELPMRTYAVEGRSPAGSTALSASFASVSPRYFATMSIPLTLGRDFSASDGENSLPVAIVSQGLVAECFNGANPIGTRLQVDGTWRTIVGVAGDVRNFRLNVRPVPAVYVPFAQHAEAALVLMARARGADPSPVVAVVKAEVHAMDAEQPVRGTRSMVDLLAASLGGIRMTTVLVGVLAAVALGLAAIGIYGVVALSVGARTREIGIRVALGATPRQVVGLVLRGSGTLAVAGAIPGLLLALAVGRLLSSKLTGVAAFEPLVFVAVLLAVVTVVAVASWVPARRAVRIQPAIATKVE